MKLLRLEAGAKPLLVVATSISRRVFGTAPLLTAQSIMLHKLRDLNISMCGVDFV